jgi:hypothetical protein
MAANENALAPETMMQNALVAAGVPLDKVRVVTAPDDDTDTDIRVLGLDSVVVVIQCGRDATGVYFMANHWYAPQDCYCITPAHIPDDPAKVAVAVARYLNNPKYDTQWPDFGWPEIEPAVTEGRNPDHG